MAEFLGDIAFIFEVLVFGFGIRFVVSGRKERSRLLSGAGWFMSVAAALGMICTMSFYFKYWNAGDFTNAYPSHHKMKGKMSCMKSEHKMMKEGKSGHSMQ